MSADDRERWSIWRDLVAPVAIIVLVAVVAYAVGGPDIFNP